MLLAQLGRQAGVVGQRADAGVLQRAGHLLHALPGLAVHHACLAQVLALDETDQLRQRLLLLLDAVSDVGPVEAADEKARVLQLQPGDDVGARQLVGRGREGDARHVGVALVQQGQLAVFGPEVVAPLAHAVRLVDGEQRQLAALVQAVQQRDETVGGHALGRGVQGGQLAARQALLHVQRLRPVQRGVEKGRLHARLQQRTHLVVHQRDQRRDDDGDALPRFAPHDGRHLVAQRLAPARGHEHQGVAAGDNVFDDGFLRATEMLVAEDVVQDGKRGGQGGKLSF